MGRNTQLSIEMKMADNLLYIKLIMDPNYFLKDGEIINKGKKISGILIHYLYRRDKRNSKLYGFNGGSSLTKL